MAVEGSEVDVDRLLRLAEQQCQNYLADVACYNGPRNFVVAGDEVSIQAIEKASEIIPELVRLKRLDNSHAFHSRLLDSIIPALLRTSGELHLKTPMIPIEACSDGDWSYITAKKIARHTREPVRFMNAIRRVEQQINSPVIWLEAGSGSPIMPMIKRAAGCSHEHVYISTFLRDADAQMNLTRATCRLWSNGIRAQFWLFHRSQCSSYDWINLPPYQFAKTSHWLNWKPAEPTWKIPTNVSENSQSELLQLLPNQPCQGESLFKINPKHELYQLGTKGHEVVEQTLCPASMYNEFVLTASRLLSDPAALCIPQLSDLMMSSPLVLDPVGSVLLRLVVKGSEPRSWNFWLFTHDEENEHSDPITHATGQITMFNSNTPPTSITHFQSLNNLMLRRCNEIEACSMSIGFKGPTVYRAMRLVVTYLDYYHGIQSIYSMGNEAVARISLPASRPANMGKGFCDPVLIDSFTQVSGILANCFARDEANEMWVCNFIDEIAFTSRFVQTGRTEQTWIAYSKYEKPSPKKLQCNIFVFEPGSGDLVLAIMAISFQKLSIKSLTKTLGRLNSQNKTSIRDAPIEGMSNLIDTDLSKSSTPQCTILRQLTQQGPFSENIQAHPPVQNVPLNEDSRVPDSNSVTLQKVKQMLSDIIEIPTMEISSDSALESLNIDSLLVTEIFAEVHQRFQISLSHSDFSTITDVQGLAQLLSASGQPPAPASASSSIRTSVSTPPSTHHSANSLPQMDVETVSYGEHDGIALSADIYYPDGLGDASTPLPIALMIHGGGHTMSTRKDVRNDQTRTLLKAGFLPISVDYRLCPEVTLPDGPMRDVCDALLWARKTLPTLALSHPNVRADGDKIVAVGWSSGGHLAMSLGWTAPPRGIKPPEAILAFYPPTDYEDTFWTRPNLPFAQNPIAPPDASYNHLYAGLHDKPVVGYSPPASLHALGGWMSFEDPRSRIVCHMNWEGRTLPVLLNGLRRTCDSGRQSVTTPADPSVEQIKSISPLAHIRDGRYNAPTFLIHGTRDDHVPWEQSQRTHRTLLEHGVPAGLAIVKDGLHMFDMFKQNTDAAKAVNDGFNFLRVHV
ncbi:MAG: hypothetical protein Q9191_000722 [Dirinaria sp. TL-2023a]